MISALFAQYRLYVYGAALLAAIGLALWYGHTRHAAGVKVTTEHYEAILASQAAALAAANQKTHDADIRADEITKRISDEYKSSVASIISERDIALRELQNHGASTSNRAVPKIPTSAGRTSATTEVSVCNRKNEIAINAAADGQLDAETVLKWQAWYNLQSGTK